MMTVTSEFLHKLGYIIRTEHYTNHEGEWGIIPDMLVETAYTAKGERIGHPELAQFLYGNGIIPELAQPQDDYCHIGWCAKQQKWFGYDWYHREWYGFSIGQMLFDPDFVGRLEHPHTAEHGQIPIETLDQARLAAVRLSDYTNCW